MENETDTNKIDLSTEALQRRREIAEKAIPGPWLHNTDDPNTPYIEDAHAYTVIGFDKEGFVLPGNATLNHIAANSPDAIIAMIAEIERLRQENNKNELVIANMDIEAWKDIHLEIMRKKIFGLEKEADWLANELSKFCGMATRDCTYQSCTYCPVDGKCYSMRAIKWREAARNAVQTGNAKA